MLECAKTIEKEGLVWGAHKLVPVGYGIKKLQLMCMVEDEKVSIDDFWSLKGMKLSPHRGPGIPQIRLKELHLTKLKVWVTKKFK